MCGIAGIIAKHPRWPLEATLARMVRSMVHRGPDGEGMFFHANLALGHRRLSILDLSTEGLQPMHSSCGRYTLSYNGEIYNYIELRDELKQRGHRFRTHTDSEVILAAYAQWGEACQQRLNGMWAFAIFDHETQRLFLSRDRFGVKPLYYIANADGFAFASEIRALLPLLPKVSADEAIVTDFILTRQSDHTPHTFFTGVSRLLGGHCMQLSLTDAQPQLSRWYQLSPAAERFAPTDIDAAASSLRGLLRDSVGMRLRSDVKVGTCLSGGIDSSSIAAMAASLQREDGVREPFGAITAISEDPTFDESRYARQIVEKYGLAWHQTRPTHADFLALLPDVVRTQEEPFTSTSLIMQYSVMQTARAQGITVLLDGQGGDETLLGYDKYYAALLRSVLRSQGPAHAIDVWLNAAGKYKAMSHASMLKYLVAGWSATARYQFYRRQHRYLKTLPPLPQHLQQFSRGMADITALQTLEIEATNLPLLLRYEDKNSMAFGVEARLPFLDYRMVEFALALPWQMKIKHGFGKYILRKAMQEMLPHDISWRRRKIGFEAPESQWLTPHEPTMQQKILASPLMQRLSNAEALTAQLPRLPQRVRFRLYSLALWEEAFL